jgi:hypothetical protein
VRSWTLPRRSLALLVSAAAATGLVVGVVISRSPSSGAGAVLAQTVLQPVGSSAAHGLATLRSSAQGRLLRVDVKDLPTDSGYYEVWLMNVSTGGTVALGTLERSHPTTFVVPAGLRLTDFPDVDISLEPLDGNPAHSSDSVARGRIGG